MAVNHFPDSKKKVRACCARRQYRVVRHERGKIEYYEVCRWCGRRIHAHEREVVRLQFRHMPYKPPSEEAEGNLSNKRRAVAPEQEQKSN